VSDIDASELELGGLPSRRAPLPHRSPSIALPNGPGKIRVGLSALFVGALKAAHTSGSFIHSFVVGLRTTLINDLQTRIPKGQAA
jgi:hypothetical protein